MQFWQLGGGGIAPRAHMVVEVSCGDLDKRLYLHSHKGPGWLPVGVMGSTGPLGVGVLGRING